jgi:hypothetical protein
VPVFAVGLGLADVVALEELTATTGGGFVYLPSGEQILDGFETLAAFLAEAYLVEWRADPGLGSFEMSVAVGGETLSDTHRLD